MFNTDYSHLRYLMSLADDFINDLKPKYIGQEVSLINSRGYGKYIIADMYISGGEWRFKVNTYLKDGSFAGTQVTKHTNIIWLEQ